jgi:hypothetical protein
MAAHNLALYCLQTEHVEMLSKDDLYARYYELYNEFLEVGQKFEQEHSRGTVVGGF